MSAAWEAYLPTVDALKPGLVDDERRQRAGLMLIRDLAARSSGSASWAAQEAYSTIQSVANACAFEAMSINDLDATRRALLRIALAAQALESVFGENRDG